MMLKKLKSLYNVEMIPVFQRRNNVSLSTFMQREILRSNNVDFGLAIKTFLFLFYNAWEIVIFILTLKR